MAAPLPTWERGTAAVLCVAGPHPIPVSTAVRTGDDRIVLALGSARQTLATLRSEPRAALCVMASGVAFTAHGTAAVVRESLASAETVVAVELVVDDVQDHLADGRTEMLGAPRWRWRGGYGEGEDAILDELERLGR
jgi:hypothetical protein